MCHSSGRTAIRADIGSWFNDPSIYDLVLEEHKRGGYRGVGEFHLTGRDAATDWVRKVVDFTVANDLYLHAHADAEAVEILIGHNPRSRIIWAHTGFSLAPERVAALLDKHAALWGELSYRGGITDDGGKLTPEWRALFERYPDRFLIGSDTWTNDRWASYGDIIAALSALARAAAARDRRKNRAWQRQEPVRRRSAGGAVTGNPSAIPRSLTAIAPPSARRAA